MAVVKTYLLHVMPRSNNKDEDFCVGDLVAVVGGDVGKDLDRKRSAMIAEVAVVGLQDIFVEIANSYPRSTFKVSKSICQKVTVNPPDLSKSSKTLIPEVGDLVISYKKSGYGSPESTSVTGVLYKINYHMGNRDMCTIMVGTDFHEVKFTSLIVLQKEASF